MAKKSILIIDDTNFVIEMLTNLLDFKYDILSSMEGEKGIEMAKELKPDLVLLDVVMPDIDGYEVCKRLKEDEITKNIPVIFLTSISEAVDEAKAFQIGGSDFITKPFVPIVVLARIRNHIKLADSMKELRRLYEMALDMNPITGYPGNNSIKKRIEKEIALDNKVVIAHADLDNFKSYNDKYGFARGDKVILYTARLMQEVADNLLIENIFIGHIGGDDFVVIIPKDKADEYFEKYIEEFDKGIKKHYCQEDLDKGKIYSKNRRGEDEEFPFVSISFAGVDLDKHEFSNYLIVNDLCTEKKKQAKKLDGSNYIYD